MFVDWISDLLIDTGAVVEATQPSKTDTMERTFLCRKFESRRRRRTSSRLSRRNVGYVHGGLRCSDKTAPPSKEWLWLRLGL